MFTRSSGKDFSALIESLQMRMDFEPASLLIEGHLQQVQSLLQDFVSTDALVTEELRSVLAKLPPSSIGRLVTSPYLCEFLMINKENGAQDLTAVRQQIVQGLVAEVLLIDPQFQFPLSPQWTLDGDVVLDSEIAKQFPALQTDCGIRLNYQSYAHNTGKPGIGGYSYEMGLKHKERIELGKKMIHQVSASAASLVDAFTLAIQFRINKNRPNVVNSSTHTSIGLIRCDNFHRLHTDMPEIVDMLVHESIHQYLHLFEEQLFAFVDLEKVCRTTLDERLYPSPWSGNLLDLRSYTHAILVWYGLWHFWNQMDECGFSHPELTREQVGQNKQEAAVGFVDSSSVLANLGEAKHWLKADYVQQIERAQQEVCRTAASNGVAQIA